MTRASSRGAWWLRAAAVANIVVLTAVRLVTDADDFNNWDLISLVNANAFSTLGELLAQPEVHFTNPFRFPGYNTGAESVISILVHRAMSGISLYWSNSVVVVVYDVMLLAGLGALAGLVYRDVFAEAAAWMLTGMSTAFLTFLALSAFNVQAYATIVAGLVGCELVLQSRRRAGILLVALAFLFLSQAYPLTFFLPLFCLVWTAARVMMALGRDGTDAAVVGEQDAATVLQQARVAVLAVLACVLVVEALSLGAYLEKVFWVVQDPLEKQKAEATVALSARVGEFFHQAFWPDGTDTSPWPGFAPYFTWLALALCGVAALFVRKGPRDVAAFSGKPVPVPGFLRPWLPAAAWGGLVLFGYLPSMFGTSLKSQRCVFGDLFLAMAVASAVAWLVRRGAHRAAVAAALIALLAASDTVYARAFLAEDHSDVHRPIFDYDSADGDARHDIDATLDTMREQLRWKDSALLVYYPRGHAENSTDPALFYARFLRRVGPWQRANWVFPCHFCDPRYGCPFPDVARRGCRRKCCYFDPVKTIDETPSMAGRRLYFWWFEDPDFHDLPRRNRVLAELQHRYWSKDLGRPGPDKRWRVFELTPRQADGKPRRPDAPATPPR